MNDEDDIPVCPLGDWVCQVPSHDARIRELEARVASALLALHRGGGPEDAADVFSEAVRILEGSE